MHSDFFGYLERESVRHALVTCVGCLHHLPVEAFDVFFRLVKSRLRPGGRLLLAEPVDTQGRQAPPEKAAIVPAGAGSPPGA